MKLLCLPLVFVTLGSTVLGTEIGREYKPVDIPHYDQSEHDNESQCYVPAISNEVGGNLYYDTINMLALSQYVYTVADLNRIARENEDNVLLKELETPKPVSKIRDALNKHLPELHDNKDAAVKESLNILKIYQNTSDQSMVMNGESNRILTAFEDEERQIVKSRVHGVIVNHQKKRVDIVFRGTANVSWRNSFADWTTNLYIRLKKYENPCEPLREKIPKIDLHGGFSKVLLEPLERGSDLTAFKNILDNQVKPHMGRGYRLYVTGHSLGGAIATLFGFFAACDDQVTKYGAVAIYSFASPRVGGSKFRQTFKYLEERGKLRHARFHNLMDIVAQKPYSFGFFKHVGLEVLLRPTGQIEFDYPHGKSWTQDGANFFRRIFNTFSLLSYHSPTEMLRRIRLCQGPLKETSLEEEYRKLWSKAV